MISVDRATPYGPLIRHHLLSGVICYRSVHVSSGATAATSGTATEPVLTSCFYRSCQSVTQRVKFLGVRREACNLPLFGAYIELRKKLELNLLPDLNYVTALPYKT